MTVDVDFGSDISSPIGPGGEMDLSPFLESVDGLEMLGQRLIRRITTPTGSVIDDEEWGIDVRAWLNDETPSEREIAWAVASQWEADECVESAEVLVTFEEGALTIKGTVETAAGPFEMVLAVSAVTVELLRLEAL